MSKYFPLRSCGAFITKFYPTVWHASSISRIGSDHASLSLMERDVCVCVCVSVHQENNTGSYCALSSSSITVTGELEAWLTLPTRYSFGDKMLRLVCESRCAGTEI